MKLRHPANSRMKSLVTKRSVRVGNRNTAVSLEEEFWNAPKRIGADQKIPIQELVLRIDNELKQSNLSSAIRLFVLDYYCQQAAFSSASR